MTEVSIVRVYGDDWDGVFANGKLVVQGHSVNLADVVLYLVDIGPVKIVSYKVAIADEEWLESYGSFPDNLNDVMMCNDE